MTLEFVPEQTGKEQRCPLLKSHPSVNRPTTLVCIHIQTGVLPFFSHVFDLIYQTSVFLSSYFGKFTCFHFRSCPSFHPICHRGPIRRADRW